MSILNSLLTFTAYLWGECMTLNLYNNGDAPNKLDKTLSSAHTVTVSNNGVNLELGVTSPIITAAGNLSGYNYAEITDFGRYYFIDDIAILRNGVTRLRLRVDPLMSFNTDIKAMQAVAMRAEGRAKQSPYLYDNRRPIQSYQVYRTYELFTFTGMGAYAILVTAG